MHCRLPELCCGAMHRQSRELISYTWLGWLCAVVSCPRSFTQLTALLIEPSRRRARHHFGADCWRDADPTKYSKLLRYW